MLYLHGRLIQWPAEEILNGQLQGVDFPFRARTAHDGLSQKRLEEDLYWLVPQVPPPDDPRSAGTELTWIDIYIFVNQTSSPHYLCLIVHELSPPVRKNDSFSYNVTCHPAGTGSAPVSFCVRRICSQWQICLAPTEIDFRFFKPAAKFCATIVCTVCKLQIIRNRIRRLGVSASAHSKHVQGKKKKIRSEYLVSWREKERERESFQTEKLNSAKPCFFLSDSRHLF